MENASLIREIDASCVLSKIFNFHENLRLCESLSVSFTRALSNFSRVARRFVAFPLSWTTTNVSTDRSSLTHTRCQRAPVLIKFFLLALSSNTFSVWEKCFQFQTVHCVQYMKSSRAPGELFIGDIWTKYFPAANIFARIFSDINTEKKYFCAIKSNSVW